ncbi:SOS response-associated peptidase [Gorillibacterium sp. sgz5001074]|uniref:SOS response-associated peptidase n=1 Tax=Gorillibacterium sp. sgz5001074 TaxID=3446695 RepID=UPI003F66C99E
MCEWISLQADARELSDHFRIDQVLEGLSGANGGMLKPTEHIPIILGKQGSRVLDRYYWGIFPFWAKDSIHARSESIRDHHAYRQIFAKQRCIIPCDGFYYRVPLGRRKEKQIRITLNERRFFGLAGLYDVWVSPAGTEYRSCTIMTTPSAEPLAAYHPRTPVILEEDTMELWLHPQPRDEDRMYGLFKPYAASALRIQA